jgi:hypothetical protein
MIQLLSAKYNKHIAYVFLLIFMSGLFPVYGSMRAIKVLPSASWFAAGRPAAVKSSSSISNTSLTNTEAVAPVPATPATVKTNKQISSGGPSQPEMSSFQPAGTKEMVNLFTGDFSYNIPLLDVGGYPVNIFYDGTVSMEQDASWVGLGWNINPGNVNRNMRGIPDDFNGEDQLISVQKMKPNKTWGINLAGDLELVGIKSLPDWLSLSIGANLGVSFNNYLGPALDLGIKGGVNFKIAEKTKGEKSGDSTALKVGAGLGANINSRYGFTLSPNVSMTVGHFMKTRSVTSGLSLSTSYNSRNGIKALHINEQVSFNRSETRGRWKISKDKLSGTYKPVKYSSTNTFTSGTSISFTKPSYIPSIRMPVTNEAWSGHFQLGGAIFGVYGSAEVEVYGQASTIAAGDVEQRKPMVGYLYYENAQNNPSAVMDFTRLNDREVTPTTPIISAPQYSYDVFSIQGEGTGGSVRAYRNDHGYMRDNYTRSRDKNLSIGVDIGIPGHFGANVNNVKTPSTIGEWDQGNLLRKGLGFKKSNGAWENVYFRNPGEISVLHDQQFNKISGTDLVRFRLGANRTNPTVEPVLEKFTVSGQPSGTVNMVSTLEPDERKKRTQVISMLTAAEATQAGLDTTIRNYNGFMPLDGNSNLQYTDIKRVSEYRKAHHISQINVTEADGRRYVYGIPVYNIRQKDFAFSVETPNNEAQNEEELVTFNAADSGRNSTQLASGSNVDGFLQITETPAYAHSFLLSGLLSPDYVDLTGNGITEDDLGSSVKFNYSKVAAVNKWRTPHTTNQLVANYNPGNLSYKKDNKGIIAYGERESWYLHSIESKTMIAFFILGNRADGKGTLNESGGVNNSDTTLKRLDRIDLYNKADLKKNGLQNARPVKSVHFQYSYTLCAGATGNNGSTETVDGQNVNLSKGKLTLDKIYFTFNKQSRAAKNNYAFSYGADTTRNPKYALNASDRWGSYKLRKMNPDNMKNADYPYAVQPQNATDSLQLQQQAGAWSLKKILLPSGGQLEIDYESDDYAYVQDRRAAAMMRIVGFGVDNNPMTNNLYQTYWPNNTPGNNATAGLKDHDRVYIKVPVPCSTKPEVFERYLSNGTPLGIGQLAFKLAVNMPAGMEYITSYATVLDYGVQSAADSIIWVQLNSVDGLSPLSLTALEFLREQLPGQAYPGYDVSESSGLKQIGEMMAGWVSAIKSAFKEPINYLRSQGLAQSVVLARSFVRLNDPDGRKFGGGNRVKKITLKDNWNTMTKQFTSSYGQEYDYSTTEVFQGQTRVISSGVASYEPGIGGEENPFQTIVQVANKLPLGPTSYGAIEMPILDAFFPAASVGYSKVTVKSLNKGIPGVKKTRSGVGRQVTEYYTAKDFPVYYNYTSLDPASDKQAHSAALNAFFYKHAFDSRALSQGFIVATNDMHGKVKSQSSYADNDSATRISYSENFYRNTGRNGLNEQFDFASNSDAGLVKKGNMGIDIELMTDTREFSVKSSSLEIQAQVDLFPVIFPIWIPFIWPVFGNSENTYRAVTTTKVINYHAILDSTVVIEKGSQVSTRNLVYDAETGSLIVSRTNNEFDKAVYNTNYPAYWAYSGMGPAYKNTDAVYTNVKFVDGKIVSGITAQDLPKRIESGDELYLINPGTTSTDNCGAKIESGKGYLLWAFDTGKNTRSLTNTAPDLLFMDSVGKFYTKDNVSFRIIRSGKRNMLNSMLAGIMSMTNPVNATTGKLEFTTNSKVINANAVEFREKWHTDNDLVKKLAQVFNPSDCGYTEVQDPNGYLEKRINPYRKGLLGNFRTQKSLLFYGARSGTAVGTATNLPDNGFLVNFKGYWDFDANKNLVPDIASTQWVWQSEATRYNAKGMELESRDAANIYSSAQYAYNKSLPVAITSNSRYYESFYEGFEDYTYQENINTNNFQHLYPKKHLLLGTMSDARILDADSMNMNAHSGKYVLGVEGGYIAQKEIDISPLIPETYNLIPKKDTTVRMVDVGGNQQFTWMYPYNMNPVPALTYNGFNVSSDGTTLTDSVVNPNTWIWWYDLKTKHYAEATQSQNYTFKLETPAMIYDLGGGLSSGYQARYVTVNIKRLDGSIVKSFDVKTPPGGILSVTATVFLCKGIYVIESTMSSEYQFKPGFYVCCAQRNQRQDKFTFTCLNYSTTAYKSLTTQNECIYNSPMAATDSIMNPAFKPEAGKKMVFSAWVRETCGNAAAGTPCNRNSYVDNNISLSFGTNGNAGVINLQPSGPIIDGWQRVDSVFVIPAGVTKMTLQLRNYNPTTYINNGTIYYDDIRIHPYNANMKSYVYDPVNLRLVAELDANNYATYYEYDAEGGLIRTKAETNEGIKTIQETRIFKQKSVTTLQ